MEIAVLGIDLGKTTCSVAGLDRDGAGVLQNRFQRHRLQAFLSGLPEPRRVCRRLRLLSRMEHHEQDDDLETDPVY